MPLKPHPTDPNKVVYYSRQYDIPELQGVTTTPSCLCGEPWRLNVVHREKSACFDYIEHPWVGLTEEELYEIYDESDDGSSPCGVCGACAKCKIEVAIARAIEAKLRSKNG
jgi:hypothetical protein